MTLDEIITEVEKRIPHPHLQLVKRVPKEEQLPVHVMLVENEEGYVQYMTMSPDGHLGAIES